MLTHAVHPLMDLHISTKNLINNHMFDHVYDINSSRWVINRPLYLHIGPSSFKLSNAHAPVVPRVAHN